MTHSASQRPAKPRALDHSYLWHQRPSGYSGVLRLYNPSERSERCSSVVGELLAHFPGDAQQKDTLHCYKTSSTFSLAKMKTLTAALFSPLALASMPSGPKHMADVNLKSTTPVAGTSNTTGGAYCGVGYTYCGYILKEQKSNAAIHPNSQSRKFKADTIQTSTMPPSSQHIAAPAFVTPPRARRRQIRYRHCLCACQSRPFRSGM